jgi:two-component system response regulator (stage 0 sporulation protein F)
MCVETKRGEMASVLVVDDNSAVRAAVRSVMERDGHKVVEVENGVEGLREYRSHPADVVVTNIVMPEMDGIELIRELKNSFPNARIIALSGYDDSGDAGYLHLAEQLGAIATLRKPFDDNVLADTVKEALRG